MQRNPLVRLFQSLVGKLIGVGKIRNPSYAAQSLYRNFDQEITEQVVRQNSTQNARDIVDMCAFCPPVVKGIRVLVDDIFSSADGDDQGVAIANDLGDAKNTPVDPLVQAIGNNLLRRIGLEDLKLYCKRVLEFGDGFGEIILLPLGAGRYQVEEFKILPTWQLFRLEDDWGNPLGFEQRVSLYGMETISFSPPQIVHVRHDRQYLYGRGVFDACVPDWINLKNAAAALSQAVDGAAAPLLYEMPSTWTPEQQKSYIQRRTDEHREGLLTLLFTTTEVQLKRLAGGNTSLNSLVDGVLYYRRAIKDHSRLPSWFWTDEPVTGGARDIAGQPALTYARYIAALRGLIGVGLRQLIDTELIFAGYQKPEQRQYRLAWPTIYTDPNAQTQAGEEAEEGTALEEQEPEVERVGRNGRH